MKTFLSEGFFNDAFQSIFESVARDISIMNHIYRITLCFIVTLNH